MKFTKMMQKMLKQDLTLLNQADDCLKKKVKEVIGLMRDELDGKIIEKLVGLRGKTYSYLKDNNDEDK